MNNTPNNQALMNRICPECHLALMYPHPMHPGQTSARSMYGYLNSYQVNDPYVDYLKCCSCGFCKIAEKESNNSVNLHKAFRC